MMIADFAHGAKGAATPEGAVGSGLVKSGTAPWVASFARLGHTVQGEKGRDGVASRGSGHPRSIGSVSSFAHSLIEAS